MDKVLIITGVAAAGVIVGAWYLYRVPPELMTLAQCRAAVEESADLHRILEGMDEANRKAAYETGALRCVLDHDPKTASWSQDKKSAVVISAKTELTTNT